MRTLINVLFYIVLFPFAAIGFWVKICLEAEEALMEDYDEMMNDGDRDK